MANNALEESHQPSGNVNSLCLRCSKFRVEDLFAMPDESVPVRIVADLGNLAKYVRDSSCPLCLLFYISSRENSPSRKGDNFYLICVQGKPTTGWFLEETCLGVCAFEDRRSEIPEHECLRMRFSHGAIGVLRDSSARINLSNASRLTLVKLPPIAKDLTFLRRWIKVCTSKHTKACSDLSNPSSWPKQLRFIDCSKRLIVEPRPVVRFAALSYVWGASSLGIRPYRVGEFLPENSIPQCIEDAMYVARSCGIRFLWVDRYCIEQVHTTEMHKQIRQMHQIYQAAYITIIDAANSGPEAGLCGVSKLCRKMQYAAQLDTAELALHGRVPAYDIKNSIWNTRAWTYQEAFFSRRKLFFTHGQVYWQCLECERLEMRPGMKFGSFMLHGSKLDTPFRILRLLREYTQRKLTYEYDAIRAFEGVFKFYEDQMSPVYHHYGIPILPYYRRVSHKLEEEPFTQSMRFAAGLCWANSYDGKRRNNFPSWSWSGWQVPISYYTAPGPSKLPCSLQSRIILEDIRQNLIEFDNYPLGDLFTSTILSQFIWIETQTIPIRIETPLNKSLLRMNQILNTQFTFFDDTKRKLYMKLFLNISTELQDNGATQCDRGEILGLILERFVAPPQYEDQQNTFVLLVQDMGEHYERIGHTFLTPAVMYSISEQNTSDSTARSLQEEGKEVPWDLCLKDMSERLIRLG